MSYCYSSVNLGELQKFQNILNKTLGSGLDMMIHFYKPSLLSGYFQALLSFLKNDKRYMEIIGYFAAFLWSGFSKIRLLGQMMNTLSCCKYVQYCFKGYSLFKFCQHFIYIASTSYTQEKVYSTWLAVNRSKPNGV